MKQLIEQTLGNSLRCILPSYWWKRLLNKMAERVATAEASAASALRIVSSALNDFSSDINSLSSRISAKQDKLTSGSNIKTINGQSVLGSGNLEIVSGVEQIIFYATESDAFPLTDAQIAHNVESMQKQRTAFLNDTPVSFLISVNSEVHQLCEPAAFYYPSNNTAIPVLFYIMGGGYYQFAVTCNWDGTATVQDVNWIDAEMSTSSKNPVQNKVVAAALSALEARIAELEALVKNQN